jgi:hypothetical protein
MFLKAWYAWIKLVFGIRILFRCPELIKYFLPEKIRRIL